jgi:hypothetical protein
MQEDNAMTFSTVARQKIALQQVMLPRPKTMNSAPTPSRLCRLSPSVLALLVVPAILGGESLLAQTHAPQTTKPAQQQKTAAEPAQPRRAAPEAIAAQPSVSPAPILPANQPPNRAKVSWDNRGLEIEASNSSLDQILRQVAADTGAKLEGLTQDQRVFGSYGPGPWSDVLLKLLDGSGYNVLMIGGRDSDAPLAIVLSARSAISQQAAANNQNRTNSRESAASRRPEPEPPPNYALEPPRPQPIQDPFANGEPPRDSMQRMDEVLHRQEKIDQQQAQQNNQQQ